MSRLPARDETAGAETVGALILFGIFVGMIAFLNVTAVPQSGLAAEEEHFLGTISDLNALQSSTEAAALPGGVGTTVSQAILLGPRQAPGSDFFSFFMATPAKASGELVHNARYGSVTVHHDEAVAGRVYDVGNATGGLPMGQLLFDPHPVFRNAGVVSLENGGLVTTDGGSQTLRYAPPITVGTSGGTTYVTIKTRILNGTPESIGGGGPARISLSTEATTLSTPPAENAMSVTMRIETRYGTAWGSYLNATARSGGLSDATLPPQFATTVARGEGVDGLDVVTWTVDGRGAGNDIRLTTGLAILGVGLS